MNFVNETGLGHIVRLLAGQHSQFFRTDVFYTTKELLFRILGVYNRQGKLRVALIGCAAGEEPYSLMMALDRAGLRTKVDLLAIDNDPRMVIKATKGIYPFSEYGGQLSMMEALPGDYRKYFVVGEDSPGFFAVKPAIKKAVHLRAADLEAEDFDRRVPKQDLIIANNVLVHVPDPQRRNKMVEKLIDRLDEGGRLIANERLGHPRLQFSGSEGSVFCYSLR